MVLGMIPGALSQTETNVEALLEFARIKKIEAEKDKAEAIEWARQNNIQVRQVLPDGTEMELMAIKDGLPMFYKTDNYGAAVTTRTDRVWPGGSLGLSLDGDLYDKLGVWDGGAVRATHVEFTSRVTQVDGATTTSDHSTHVAGTMIANGIDGAAKGMAFEAFLDAYEWTSDLSEMTTAASAGMEISNHSYGFRRGWDYNSGWSWWGNPSISTVEDYYFGFYDSYAQDWDALAYIAPYYLIVKSAGNDRGDGPSNAGTGGLAEFDGGADGYDCIAHAATAKNVLTVGAVSEVPNYTGPGSVAMTSFSGWGPLDDGRVKPDIVGRGEDLYSCSHDADNAYTNKGGTSMSSPNVTGSLALIQQHYQNLNSGTPLRSATLKALVLHTADECGSNKGPDYRFGWGLLNTERAVQKITEDNTEQNVIDELTLNDGNTWTRDVTVSGNASLKVTVVWTDPAGTPVSASLNPPDIMLVNDLDLSISDGSKATYYPYSLDQNNPSNAATTIGENNVDNVEMVYIETTTTGIYTITVDHDGTLSGGSQAFSIVISGINEYTNPPVCASNFTNPGDGAADVSLFPNLVWSEVGNADSYVLHVGTDGGGLSTPTDVLNGYPVGTNSYQLSNLSPNKTYYIQVFPQNNAGISSGCSIWSFSTLNPISLPYFEDFDAITPPALPIGYIAIDKTIAYWQSSTDMYYTGSGPNSMGCYNPSVWADADSWLFTPPIYMIAGNDYNVSFYYRVYTSSRPESLKVMVGTEPSESGMTTTLFDDPNITTISWPPESNIFTPDQTCYFYIGFYAYSTDAGGIYFDDFSISETDHTSIWSGSADGDWSNSSNWSSGIPVDGDHAIIPGSLSTYPTVDLGDGAHVDYITIEDGGSLIGAEHLTVDGSAFMQRYFSPYSNVADVDGWHIISSPMQGMPITGTDFVPGSWSPHLDDLFVWDEDDYYWRNYKVHFFSPFNVGEGYLHAVETAATKEFYGSFNVSDVTFNNLSYTPAMGNGWHMIGNPFQSALIWNETGGDWTLSSSVMAIAKILKNDGTGYRDLLIDDQMAANQGFFIKVMDASNSITIPLTSRTHSDTAFQKSSGDVLKLKAVLEDERYISINIGLNNQATVGFDAPFDGYHMSFTGIADMYSYHEGDRLSTNYIPYPDDLLSLPVIFHPYQNRDYVMKAENIELVLPEYEITLEDKKASQVVDLRETEAYAFSSNKNDDPERFVLHLKNATGIRDGLNENGISMYMENKELNILVEQPVQGQVSVINAMGQIIYHGELERKGINRYKLNVSPGAYLVRVLGPGLNYTGKIAIR